MRPLRTVAATAVVAACTLLGSASHASAGLTGVVDGVLDKALSPCDQTGMTQRFIDWNDPRYYVPAPGGAFDDRADGWQLGSGVKFSRKGNPYGTSNGSIQLDGGESVVSPPICVYVDYTVSRMFAKLEKGGSDSSLSAEVLYEDTLTGQTSSKETELPVVDSGWNPTGIWSMPVLNQVVNPDLSLDPVEVRFRFSASPGSRWLIDDVWVDPRMRR